MIQYIDTPSYNAYLQHYGVKGMKWGVRRYQKKAGIKTKKRLDKWKEAESRYDKAKASGNKIAMKSAKKDMSSHYKKLKQAKLADQGAKLYQNSNRINSNNRISYGLMSAGGSIISAGTFLTMNADKLPLSISRHFARNIDTPLGKLPIGMVVSAVGGTAIGAAGATKMLVDEVTKNRKLRAFYSYREKD